MIKQPEEPTLIPTRSRGPISRDASYPLSAHVVSDGLRGAPQFDRLALRFDSHPQSGPVAPEQIIFASISCRSPDEWEVWVGALPSEMAAPARRFAVDHGLPYLLAWLQRPRADTWFLHWHRCAMAVDPITYEGVLAEFEENRLVEQLPPVRLVREGPPSRRTR